MDNVIHRGRGVGRIAGPSSHEQARRNQRSFTRPGTGHAARPAELADALPYLLGFHPTDSVVMVALHGARGRFGGRLRLGIPRSPQEWQPVADQLADGLVTGSENRGRRPEGIIVFLCQDPGPGRPRRMSWSGFARSPSICVRPAAPGTCPFPRPSASPTADSSRTAAPTPGVALPTGTPWPCPALR